MNMLQFIHSSFDGHLYNFQLLAVTGIVAVNFLEISSDYICSSVGYKLRMKLLVYSRYCQFPNGFISVCIIIDQMGGFTSFSILVFSTFFILVALVGMWCYHIFTILVI